MNRPIEQINTDSFHISAISIQGPRNKANEDSYYFLADQGIFLVADGMGGRGHGDIASGMTVKMIAMALQVLKNKKLRNQDIIAIIKVANQRVYEKSKVNLNVRGMGTTLVMAWIHGSHLTCFHVGDSRAYLMRDFRFEQLTHDHSAKQVDIDSGKAKAGAITRAIGVRKEVNIEVSEYDWEQGDKLLLTSDGITDPLKNFEINNILEIPQKDNSNYLVELVTESQNRGGKDDKTALFVVDSIDTEANTLLGI